jgi:hypothetical protein
MTQPSSTLFSLDDTPGNTSFRAVSDARISAASNATPAETSSTGTAGRGGVRALVIDNALR